MKFRHLLFAAFALLMVAACGDDKKDAPPGTSSGDPTSSGGASGTSGAPSTSGGAAAGDAGK